MAITLTPALDEEDAVDADGNTYCTLAVANTYFEGRLDAETWNTAGEERQQQALLTAMRVLESLKYVGLPSTTTQPLAWPRVANTPRERGQVGRGRYSAAEILGETSGLYDTRGRKWLVTEIPTPIQNAQCEIALAMLTDRSLNEMALRKMLQRSKDLEIDHRQPAGFCVASARECLAGLLRSGMEIVRG